MPHAAFFLASGAWNLTLGMTWLVVPLYAHALGLSNAEIGTLFALPVFAQAPLNLAGGAYSDRIGGRRIMLGSCCATIAAGIWFIFSQGFWMLLVGQLTLILSRAAFWPATWAMATELAGDRARQLGTLNAITNFGQIVGTVLCGFMLAAFGFTPTFAALAGMGFLALLAGMATRHAAPKAGVVRPHLLHTYFALLRKRIICYTMACAYLSALPMSLTASFYPLLLAQFGHGEGESGVLISLRAVGSILASLVAARMVRTGAETLWPVLCGVAVAASVGFLPVLNHAVPIGFWMLVAGVGTAAMTIYFQITISEASLPEERGSALALGGMGWSVSHLSTPLIMGLVADRYGIVVGFYVLGVLSFACAIAIAWARNWAFRDARPASSPA